MKKLLFSIICLLLIIVTQCNWYVQYQHSDDVLFEDLPHIVQDSIESVNTRYYFQEKERGSHSHSLPEIISVDDIYTFKTKYIPLSPAGGSWVDYFLY